MRWPPVLWWLTAMQCQLLARVVSAQADNITSSSTSATASPVAPSCLPAKQACDHDEECVHRIVYLHETCGAESSAVAAGCSVDCRSAVLNLFQLPLGRALLRSDLDCVPSVRPQLRRCSLMPTALPLYCSLAKMHCDTDDECAALRKEYLRSCEYKLARGECPVSCANALSRLYATQHGTALSQCVCWDSRPADIVCQNFQGHLSACHRTLHKLQQSDAATDSMDSISSPSSPTSPRPNTSESADSLIVVAEDGLQQLQHLASASENSAASLHPGQNFITSCTSLTWTLLIGLSVSLFVIFVGT